MSLQSPRRRSLPGLPGAGALSARALGVLEALATPHGLDRYLELVNPMLTVRELRAVVTDVRHGSHDTTTVTLRPTRQWQGFRAGQFVQLSVDIDGVRRTRCYSPANSQYRADGQLELTVKAHPYGLVSNYLYAHAEPGMVLGLSQAGGGFTLPDTRPERTLLLSGGSGITPVMAMLRTLCDEGHQGEIVFLHYAFTAKHVSYLAELRDIEARHDNVRVVLAYTEQEVGGDLQGLFHQQHLAEVAPWYADAQTYLCGPPGLMTSIRAHFVARGVADRLHSEDFAPTAPAVDTAGATGELTFARTGTTAANSGKTLLEQAEDAGLSPEYGCRMGICFSCTQVKRAGTVRNVNTGDVDSDPDCEVQLCINVPVGDVDLDL
ncbi:Ferredoxin-NADP reductase [Jatrophihabitans endophyticus]|uniref:Ferredoxin-NADP reductase n=1 Tax=Jatrophihabitans endophyticus TaxID=1206085 RepID=A0A1M5PKK3_9ACTN|nr:FAD-binding oxidoreductase [Jatrophihabitans endophyticus]SHH02298.1 Ferredoxin-NADP reductase [Jatrophihabitans endophyticus]